MQTRKKLKQQIPINSIAATIAKPKLQHLFCETFLDTAMEAAASGCGKTLLPTIIAQADERLQQLKSVTTSRLPIREIWLLSHADQREFSAVSTVISWIEDTVIRAIKK